MADDPINQQQFAEDVAASAAAGDGQSFVPGDRDFKMPSAEEVWKLIQGMDGISDEERENLREGLFNPPDPTSEDFMKRFGGQPAMGHTPWDYYIFFAMIAIILLVFALFGYKLYKSLVEKETKKQEKLKSKQSKKAKKTN